MIFHRGGRRKARAFQGRQGGRARKIKRLGGFICVGYSSCSYSVFLLLPGWFFGHFLPPKSDRKNEYYVFRADNIRSYIKGRTIVQTCMPAE